MVEPRDTLNCEKSGKCGGCPFAGKSLAEQRAEKASRVAFLNEKVRFRYMPTDRVRDRADLVWEDGRLGLFGAAGPSGIIDLPRCPMMTAPLEKFFLDFKKMPPPIAGRGSVRLRVSPSGERGVWLDFANADVKTLFEQRDYLQFVSDLAFVEIGQRRKAFVWRDGQPKLVEPMLQPWFETYDGQGSAIPLYGPVGGFSQAGFAANRALVDTVCELASRSGCRDWLELFSGNGNFALALAARGFTVEAVELDELAISGLALSLDARPDLRANLKFQRADVYLQEKKLPPLNGRSLLVDPPRAGLRELLARIRDGDRPKFLLYVSCHSESFVSDTRELLNIGYKLSEIFGVDQFPHSNHSEWVALFSI